MTIGSGHSGDEYDRKKRARDKLEKALIDHGTKPDTAKRIADKTANETENRRKSGEK